MLRLSMRHQQVRPYPPLPLYRSDTIVQHYMQPEEFMQFHRNACADHQAVKSADGQAVKSADGQVVKSADAESNERIAAVYDSFVRAKVMRR